MTIIPLKEIKKIDKDIYQLQEKWLNSSSKEKNKLMDRIDILLEDRYDLMKLRDE